MRGRDIASAREAHRGRHVVVRVELEGGETYVLKLGCALVCARERAWYRRVTAAANRGGEACRFVDEDLGEGALLFAVDPAAVDAREYAVTHQGLPPHYAAGVARTLAALHGCDGRGEGPARIAPASAWRTDCGTDAERLRARCEDVQAALVTTAVIHADVRWENTIVAGDAGEPVLIDWEDAGRGAPAWDVGCLLASFASFAIRADARFGTGPAAAALHAAMRVQTAAAWDAYRARSDRARESSFLADVVRCSGVRLAEAALAPSATALSPAEIVALVDASAEMLDEPRGAAERRYGII